MITFRSITDKALDVDPDLRFMAIEDFKKLLSKENQIQIEEFVPTLFNLLHDSNANVQSQTIKLFPTLLPYISNTCIIQTISRLFGMVSSNMTDPDQVAAMTLKLILNFGSTEELGEGMRKSVVSTLLHKLLVPDINSVVFDILIELIKTYSKAFEPDQFLQASKYLVEVCFSQSSNGTGKKAIYAFDLLLERNMRDVAQTLLTTINSYSLSSFNEKYNRYQLILRLIKHSWAYNYDSSSIIEDVQAVLVSDLEEFDYDQIVEDNLLKEVSLDILIECKSYDSDIIIKYINYNPLQDDDEDIEYEDDDIEFSDDEVQEQESFDDGSWKLRYKTIKLIEVTESVQYLNRVIGKLNDKNEIILKSAVKCLWELIDKTELDLVPSIETKISGNLNNESLTSYISLLEKVIKHFGFSSMFIESLLNFLNQNEKNLELAENLNLVLLIVESMDVKPIETSVNAIVPSLCDKIKSSPTIAQLVLKILDQLSISLTNPMIFSTLVDRLDDSKILIELKIELLNSVTVYILNNHLSDEQLQKSFQIFESNLTSESILKTNLINLNKIFDEKNPNFSLFSGNSGFMSMIGGLKGFLNDGNHGSLILQLVNKLGDFVDLDKLLQYGKLHSTDFKVVNLILVNLNLRSQLSTDELSFFIEFSNSIDITDDIEHVEFDVIIPKLSNINTFTSLKQRLNLDRVSNIKLLSLITIELNLEDEINASVEHLNQMISDKSFDEKFLQLLQYLSFINLDHKLDININELIELLSLEELNDSVKFEISKNLGYLTNTSSNLLIQKYISCDNELIKINLLNSIKFFIKNFDDSSFEEEIYKILLDQVNVIGISKEFKMIGEILSIISVKQKNFGEISNLVHLKEQSTGLMFTNLVILNHLILDLKDEKLITELVLESVKFFEIINIDIKTMLVKNFINLYYNFPQVFNDNIGIICDKLFAELQPYAEFKKIIPMGPYKYIIDEGLEIRKLVFEVIYTIINDDKITKDFNLLLKSVIQKGLSDKELDIVNLSCMSLSSSIQKYPEYYNNSNNVSGLTEILNASLSRKLKSKATAQETEVYKESKNNLVNLIDDLDRMFQKHNWNYSNWHTFYQSRKEEKEKSKKSGSK